MNARGIVSITVIAAVMLVGCTSDADTAGELQDIREVLGGSDEDAPSAEPEAAEPGDEAASAEAPPEADDDGELPPPDPEIDVTTVPDDITVKYVQAVIDELERIYAEAVVLMMEEGELTIEITDRIGEIFAVRQLGVRRTEFTETAEAGFPGMRPSDEIETRRRIVQDILDQGDGCLYVETVTSDQAFFVDAVEPIDVYVLLEAPTVERPVDINPTPWVYGALGVGEQGEMKAVTPCSE